MYEPRVTFAELRELLAELGFAQVKLADGHVGFHRGDPKTMIAMPAYGDEATIMPRHLAAVRVMLVNQGVVSGEEFDQIVACASHKHSAS